MRRILEVAVPRTETKSGRLLLPCLLSLFALTSTLRAQTVTEQVPVGNLPEAVAVNPVTNQIYVANTGGNNVTVIDGATGNPTFLGPALAPARWLSIP